MLRVSQVLSSWGGWEKLLSEGISSKRLFFRRERQLLQLKQVERRVSAEPRESSLSLMFSYKALYAVAAGWQNVISN